MSSYHCASTVAEQIEMILNPKPEADHRSLMVKILQELPQDIKPPVTSNVGSNYKGVSAWLSFNGPAYDPNNTHNPLDIVKALENVGWKLLPASLAKYGNYRAAVWFGNPDQLPEQSSRAKFVSAESILPVYVRGAQHNHSKPSLEMYMQTPSGFNVKVLIAIPHSLCLLNAKRAHNGEYYYYVRGTGSMSYKPTWSKLFGGILSSRCYVDTDDGLSGELYWNHKTELSASEIVSQLLA